MYQVNSLKTQKQSCCKKDIRSRCAENTPYVWLVTVINGRLQGMQQRQFDAIGDLVEFMRQCMFCMHRYEERIDRVETRITARLRDQLGTARNANETFLTVQCSVCSATHTRRSTRIPDTADPTREGRYRISS